VSPFDSGRASFCPAAFETGGPSATVGLDRDIGNVTRNFTYEDIEMNKLAATLLATCLTLGTAGALAGEMSNDAMKNDAMSRDAMKKDAQRGDAMTRSGAKTDSMGKPDAMAKDAMGKDAMAHDAAPKDAMKK
jgi:pentapeptide MXKDX repeat protein